MRRYLIRAWRDTYSALGGAGLFVPVLFVLPVGLAIHYWFDPSEAMSEAEIWIVYGLAATGVVFGSFFLWNLACAPYRIERDARVDAELKIENLSAQIAAKPVARGLDAEQRASLASAIRSAGVKPKSLDVLYQGIGEECIDFAEDIGQAVRMSDIPCSVHDGLMYSSDASERGIKIVAGESSTIRNLADAIERELRHLGYLPERRLAKDRDSIFLYIARSAKSEHP